MQMKLREQKELTTDWKDEEKCEESNINKCKGYNLLIYFIICCHLTMSIDTISDSCSITNIYCYFEKSRATDKTVHSVRSDYPLSFPFGSAKALNNNILLLPLPLHIIIDQSFWIRHSNRILSLIWYQIWGLRWKDSDKVSVRIHR